MECNKEEAIKARGIAEEMMGKRDFVGAKKFASKAQKLFPNLENITQMVLVCEVHCCAEKQTFGNEKDWYDILKVEPTADDGLIRKQYRKFALLLHPDKNRFPGAADAFSLIGEARTVLLDQPKRMLYNNSRHIPSGRFQIPINSDSEKVADETLARNPFMHSEVSQESNRNGNPQRSKRTVTSRDNLSEGEGPSKRYKGVGYPSPTKESEHLSTPDAKEEKLMESLHNTEQKAETAKGSVDVGPSEPKTFECATELNQVPEPKFYRFDAERSPDKFQIGQCWAIYSDKDALPRYYGQIKKIDLLPEFVLHVAWFNACPLPKSTTQWHDKTMPIGCGLFKVRNSRINKYTVTNNVFSHVVAAEPLNKGVYKIYPREGEVWAIYKNWSAELKGSELEDFEYEIVEIVDVSDRYVDVKFLMWVKGFKFVYKPRVEEADRLVKISVSNHLMFSHRIPSFRLTEERGGSLRGFWELDPEGMPLYLLCKD